MTGPSWLVDSRRIASKIKNASESVDSSRHTWVSNPTKTCPRCHHTIDNSDVVHEWPGLPKGVKFDPSDQELLWHLLSKVRKGGATPHPFINEFIPTVEEEEGICYTHPKRLPGVKQDGSVSHFFHRTFKAYNTGTRKRRKINSDDLGDVRWHKTGKTKPVIVDGQALGCKKILVLYTSTVKGGKPEKTNWVMHQYHIGTEEDEKDGEYVVSKLFYQQQTKPGDKSVPDMMAVDPLATIAAEMMCTPDDEFDNPENGLMNVDYPDQVEVDLENSDGVHQVLATVEEHNHEVLPTVEEPNHEVHAAVEEPHDEDVGVQPTEEGKWWDSGSQFLLDSQQLAEGIAICDELLDSQTSCGGGGDETKKSKPRLADYAHMGKEVLKRDLEECCNLGNTEHISNNVEVDNSSEFRLSQLEFGSQDSLMTWAAKIEQE